MVTAEQFATEYREHFNGTIRFLARRGAKSEEATEFAQAGWARAWEKRSQYEGRCQFGVWVNTIAYRLMVMWLRRSDSHALQFNKEYDFRVTIEPHDARIDVESILNALKPWQSEILISHDILGNQYDPNSSTEKVRRCRALKAAREIAA